MSKRRSAPKKLNVSDAAVPIAMIQAFIANTTALLSAEHPAGIRSDARAHDMATWAQATAKPMLQAWQRSPVVLRVDPEFVGALLTSETDAEVTADVLTTVAFDALAFSFAEPIALYDGTAECSYYGAIVTGASTQPKTSTMTWTTYPPLRDAEGFRVLWLYTEAGDPTPRLQTTSVMLAGPLGRTHTIGELIEAQHTGIAEQKASHGQEMSTLIPLAVLLPLCLAATEPDLELLAPETISRPQQLQTSQVGNLGWRTGAALRAWRAQPPAPVDADGEAASGLAGPGPGGWRLPPHIRRAHWHRVRVATRDENGVIVGDRSGVQDIDWTYRLRLYAPTPVAAKEAFAPVVRHLEA
jgi:hypothetical protein